MASAPVEDLAQRLRADGLPVPSLDDLPGAPTLRGDWHLSTRDTEPSTPYRLDDWVIEFLDDDPDDYAVLAHAGHGAESWAISYLVVRGRVGVFVQSAWGGASASEAKRAGQVERMTERFAAADRLRAASAGRLGAGQRLVVVDSDVGRQAWAVVDDGARPEWHGSATPIDDALAWLEG